MNKIIYIVVICFSSMLCSQNETVQWLSFEELEQALIKAPKKVFINFYADWCVYCKKMEDVVFTKPKIRTELQSNYYALRFNVESTDSIQFGGKTFKNLNSGKKRMAFHQIAELLAGRPNRPLELPALVILDKDFIIQKRFYRYIAPTEMLTILKN